jgi:hypothetical protein
MTRRHKSSLVLFLCLQAMAVAIICFGSLINFHQYKIWGKPLIPNFVGYKRDIEKYSKTISFSKLTRDNQHLQNDFQGNDCEFPVETLRARYGSGSGIFFDFSQKEPVTHRVSSSGLRGPPIS